MLSFFKKLFSKKKKQVLDQPQPQPQPLMPIPVAHNPPPPIPMTITYQMLDNYFKNNQSDKINEQITKYLDIDDAIKLGHLFTMSAKYNKETYIFKIIESKKKLNHCLVDHKTPIMFMINNKMYDCMAATLNLNIFPFENLYCIDNNHNNIIHYLAHVTETENFNYLVQTLSTLLSNTNNQKLTPLETAMLTKNYPLIKAMIQYPVKHRGNIIYGSLFDSDFFIVYPNELNKTLYVNLLSVHNINRDVFQYKIINLIFNLFSNDTRTDKYAEWFNLKYNYPLTRKKRDIIIKSIENKNYDLIDSLYKVLKATPRQLMIIINKPDVDPEIIHSFNENYLFEKYDPVYKIEI